MTWKDKYGLDLMLIEHSTAYNLVHVKEKSLTSHFRGMRVGSKSV